MRPWFLSRLSLVLVDLTTELVLIHVDLEMRNACVPCWIIIHPFIPLQQVKFFYEVLQIFYTTMTDAHTHTQTHTDTNTLPYRPNAISLLGAKHTGDHVARLRNGSLPEHALEVFYVAVHSR